jgi:hypothetical protein
MSADDVADGMADTILGGVLVAQAKKPAQRRAVARR